MSREKRKREERRLSEHNLIMENSLAIQGNIIKSWDQQQDFGTKNWATTRSNEGTY
jgi:hypothetical protein